MDIAKTILAFPFLLIWAILTATVDVILDVLGRLFIVCWILLFVWFGYIVIHNLNHLIILSLK